MVWCYIEAPSLLLTVSIRIWSSMASGWLQRYLCCFHHSTSVTQLKSADTHVAMTRLQQDIQRILIYQYQNNCVDPVMVHQFGQVCAMDNVFENQMSAGQSDECGELASLEWSVTCRDSVTPRQTAVVLASPWDTHCSPCHTPLLCPDPPHLTPSCQPQVVPYLKL
jgi:hypothetical protein